jgi:hypothetical protein
MGGGQHGGDAISGYAQIAPALLICRPSPEAYHALKWGYLAQIKCEVAQVENRQQCLDRLRAVQVEAAGSRT